MKIAVLGLKGHHGYALQGARTLQDCQIVAVADQSLKAAENFIAGEPLAKGAQAYADWRHLVEHELFDLALVGDENGLRAEQLIALFARNVHILTEKPLTTTLEDLDRVKRAFAKSTGRLSMLLTMRYDPKYSTVRRLVQSGAIGQVRQASAQKSYRLGQRPEWQKHRDRLGGTIPYIGIHSLDLIRWCTALEFTHVAAFHSAGVPEMKETEDSASILAAMTEGVSATVRLDYLRPESAPSHGDDRLRIVGTKGIVETTYALPKISLITAADGPQEIEPEPSVHLLPDFVRSWSAEDRSRITPDDCFKITEVVLQARQAADEKRLIALS